nr:triple gene block 1 protein [Plantago yellow mosaic virus]
MNTVISLLEQFKFQRTKEPLSTPLVVHAVAGAGKSTLIRAALEADPSIRAYTHGVPDPPSLDANSILSFNPNPPSHTTNLLDEYPVRDPPKAFACLLADPLQHTGVKKRPHFISRKSHRLGPSTAKLLATVGIHFEGAGPAILASASGIFDAALFGKIIALDSTVGDLLRRHGVVFSFPHEVLGQEFPIVTVVSALSLPEVCDKESLYIACSRHTQELHVRAPGASDTSC